MKKKGACFSLSPAPILVTTATFEMPASFIAVMMFVVPSHQERGEAERQQVAEKETARRRRRAQSDWSW